jgi:hypothetical protein
LVDFGMALLMDFGMGMAGVILSRSFDPEE